MTSNLDRFKKDLERLIKIGNELFNSIQVECYPEKVLEQLLKTNSKESAKEKIAQVPPFKQLYQEWYSESKVLIKQLLPDRLDDFIRLFEKPKSRKDITYENYKIEDYLQGLTITRGHEKNLIVGPDAAINQFRQQYDILIATKRRFESSLFDIKLLLQADLFDCEIDSAIELAKNKYYRAAGVIAGVILEKHLSQVCGNHSIKSIKKNSTISDYNNLLKENSVIETPQWRFIQHLGDIRNLCGHDKKIEPTGDQVQDLIAGVAKTIKILF